MGWRILRDEAADMMKAGEKLVADKRGELSVGEIVEYRRGVERRRFYSHSLGSFLGTLVSRYETTDS